MTVEPADTQDWTYRAARNRMVEAARRELPQHAALARVDDDGNRVIECSCRWVGNVLGWASHLDAVVRSALDAGARA
jgi:hypothetical protein